MENGSEGAFVTTMATRLPAGAPVGQVWPEQWLTLFRLLDR